MIIMSAEASIQYMNDWRRECDEMYETHNDRLTDALMDRWRGVAYYICENCRQTYGRRDFHLVPVHNNNNNKKNSSKCSEEEEDIRSLQPRCRSCYLYYEAVENLKVG